MDCQTPILIPEVARMASSIRKVLRKALASLDLPSSSNETPDAHQRRADEHVVTIVLDRGVKSIAAVHAVMLESQWKSFEVGWKSLAPQS